MENKRTETPLRRALEEYIDAGQVEDILGGYSVDFVVDAIDTVAP